KGDKFPQTKQSPLESYWHGGQAQALSRLRERISSASERSIRFVVTGRVGVGKTITLRRLARELASEFASHLELDRPLPLFYPLGRMKFEPQQIKQVQGATNEDPQTASRILTNHWLAWANNAISEDIPTGTAPVVLLQSWLEDRLARKPTVVIFDG